MVEQKPGSFKAHFHIRNPMSNRLLFANRCPKLTTLLCMRYDLFKLTFHLSDIRGKQTGSLPLHRSFEDKRPLSLQSQPVVQRHTTLIQVNLAGRRAGQPHLCKWLTNAKTRSTFLDEEASDTEISMREIC